MRMATMPAFKPLIKKCNLILKNLNYWPILNLPFLSIMLEKAILTTLSFYKKQKQNINGLCEEYQSGFRQDHSTETALIRVTNDFLLSSDRGCISLSVLLDLSAAFENIHNIHLNRFYCYEYDDDDVGISGIKFAWFKSFI